jgi:hypothetical protein
MSAQVVVSILAVIVSLASFSFAWSASRRAARAEEIENLLGEKETVAFGAVKLLRDGLPGELRRHRPVPPWTLHAESRQRELVIAALIAACVFEGSDRARLLLFKVVEKYRDSRYRAEFERQWLDFKQAIESMKTYEFEKKELNLRKANLRLEALRKVLHNERAPTSAVDDEALKRTE